MDDLQELSLAEAGELKLMMQRENIADLVNQAVTAIQHNAENKGVIIETNLPDDINPVIVDRQRIDTIFHLAALLSAAGEAAPRCGTAAFSDDSIVKWRR